MIARASIAAPSVRGVGTALLAPAAFICIGHVLLLVGLGEGPFTDVVLSLVLIWPGLGFAFSAWIAGVAERRAGGDRRSTNVARVLGLSAYMLFALVYVFGIPFDNEFFLGGLDSGAGGID